MRLRPDDLRDQRWHQRRGRAGFEAADPICFKEGPSASFGVCWSSVGSLTVLSSIFCCSDDLESNLRSSFCFLTPSHTLLFLFFFFLLFSSSSLLSPLSLSSLSLLSLSLSLSLSLLSLLILPFSFASFSHGCMLCMIDLTQPLSCVLVPRC
jgi:hypothetical protein